MVFEDDRRPVMLWKPYALRSHYINEVAAHRRLESVRPRSRSFQVRRVLIEISTSAEIARLVQLIVPWAVWKRSWYVGRIRLYIPVPPPGRRSREPASTGFFVLGIWRDP